MDFAELVNVESKGLQAAVFAILGDAHRSEEIVQEAFERCYRRWWRVSRMDRPGAWVRRVAINAAISSVRRSTNERRTVERLGVAPAPPDRSESQQASFDDHELWLVVRELPKEQAIAVALRYGADLSVADTAVTMQATEASVRSLLHRGRAALRDSASFQALAE